jgi:hypothetical protein
LSGAITVGGLTDPGGSGERAKKTSGTAQSLEFVLVTELKITNHCHEENLHVAQ